MMEVHQAFHAGVLICFFHVALQALLQLCLHFFAKLVQCLVIPKVLGELVVQFRQDPCLHLLDLRADRHGFAGETGVRVFGRIVLRHVHDIALLFAEQRLVQGHAEHRRLVPDPHEMIFGRRTGDRRRTFQHLDMQLRIIIFRHPTVRHEDFDLGMLLANHLHRLVEFLVCDGSFVLLERDAFVLTKLEGRLDLHRGGKHERQALLDLDAFERRDVDRDRREAGLLHRALIIIRNDGAENILLDALGVPLFQQ